ncbi:uncharacterized protein LY89DRAFT_706374 [Mollisia scopiformis]|uniref:alpha-galactosidase n=1 Tax=Mollisia scopiformis TaxID=149040 RepID=A0A194XEW1_MOLSC|nr:uncharacterized protein LY89DRAFT_706374 [Mollisia scopiformis]KUJ18686.1 hypothetical protein LY89DRAFT_706374 [Mollisia scopiformis]
MYLSSSFPTPGATWQIQIDTQVNPNHDVQVFDIDLFENQAADVANLHSMGKYVICYFSAGTREYQRSDDAVFATTTIGKNYSDSNGLDKEETWFNTKEDAVRQGMMGRIRRAKDMGCDAVDPDNVDTYDNDTGFNTGDLETDKANAIDYMNFLYNYTSTYNGGMDIGLKNGAAMISSLIDKVAFEVNENCANLTECASFRDFINKGKPVFEIEYPVYLQNNAPVDNAEWTRLCRDNLENGASQQNAHFSTVLKRFGLGDFTDPCGANPVTPTGTT